MRPPETLEEWQALFALPHPPRVADVPPVTIGRDKKRRRREVCIHHAVVVDERTRSIACSRCDANVDPIDALARIARDGSWVVSLANEKRMLAIEVEALRREVSLLKAQRKRATR